MPYTTNVAGTTITAAWGNANIRDQVITPFASASARDAAITSPIEGMYADLTDLDLITRYDGSQWVTPFYRQRTTPGSPVASITFATIPTYLRVIKLSWAARGDAALASVAISLRVNGDTGNNYATAFTQITTLVSDIAQSSMKVGNIPANTAAASQYASGVIDIVGWDQRSKLNPAFNYTYSDPSSAANAFWGIGGGLYNAAGAYTSLTLLPGSGNFIGGSEFVLHGWE